MSAPVGIGYPAGGVSATRSRSQAASQATKAMALLFGKRHAGILETCSMSFHIEEVSPLSTKSQTCPTRLKRRKSYISHAAAPAVAPCCKPQPGRVPGSFLGAALDWDLLGNWVLKVSAAAPKLITVEVLVNRKGGFYDHELAAADREFPPANLVLSNRRHRSSTDPQGGRTRRGADPCTLQSA
ncbi:unnamed protein product, partial [Brugia timori]|uniref:Uncharacterized protein n=1 Tax=Brugia timori TaxID=42155 RepID=A0A0R3QJB2_9BILA